jgi:hypothetical protein
MRTEGAAAIKSRSYREPDRVTGEHRKVPRHPKTRVGAGVLFRVDEGAGGAFCGVSPCRWRERGWGLFPQPERTGVREDCPRLGKYFPFYAETCRSAIVSFSPS